MRNPTRRGHGRRSGERGMVEGLRAHPVLPFIGAGAEGSGRSCARAAVVARGLDGEIVRDGGKKTCGGGGSYVRFVRTRVEGRGPLGAAVEELRAWQQWRPRSLREEDGSGEGERWAGPPGGERQRLAGGVAR